MVDADQLEVHRLADQREEPDPDLEQVHVGHPLSLRCLEGDVPQHDVAALDLQGAGGELAGDGLVGSLQPEGEHPGRTGPGLHVDQPAADEEEDEHEQPDGPPEQPAQPPAPAGGRRTLTTAARGVPVGCSGVVDCSLTSVGLADGDGQSTAALRDNPRSWGFRSRGRSTMCSLLPGSGWLDPG